MDLKLITLADKTLMILRKRKMKYSSTGIGHMVNSKDDFLLTSCHV